MTGSKHITVRISRYLLRKRWSVTVLLALFYAVFEFIEHPPAGHGVDLDFLSELLILAGVFPLTFGITLTLLARAEAERSRAVHHLNRHHELNQQLINSLNWDELARVLVRFPRTIAPLLGVSLLVYDEASTTFELAAEWWYSDGAPPPKPSTFLDSCRACIAAQSRHSSALIHCDSTESPCAGPRCTPEQCNRYCLPLMHGGQLIALLQLHSAPGYLLTGDQIEMLNSLAHPMALAIDSARPRPSDSIRAAAVRAERRRIARQLHDILGQNLSYLTLKLSQLTGDDALQEIAAVREEVERMRDIANEAYEQVRGTLITLRPDNSIDLATALLALAQTVGNRAGFQVELTSEGRPRSLPAQVRHQVLDIFREALANVEKHANAQRVVIDLQWAEDMLRIDFVDDGQGFDPDAIVSNGHFGLAIMRERAEEIGGRLTLVSRPNLGTELTLQLPLTTGFRHIPEGKGQNGDENLTR